MYKHKFLNEIEKQMYHFLWKNDIFTTRGLYNGQFIAVLSKHLRYLYFKHFNTPKNFIQFLM